MHLQLDSLPFHMQVMSDEKGWYTELRYWENRFDPALLDIFLNSYEHVLLAMLEERSARRLKKHLPLKKYLLPRKHLPKVKMPKRKKNLPLKKKQAHFSRKSRAKPLKRQTN